MIERLKKYFAEEKKKKSGGTIGEEQLREMKAAGIIRRHYTFYGRVQGVGFRYRAQAAALDLDLTGWVENQSNGTVEMELQGQNEQMSRMINRLRTDQFIRIDDFDVYMMPLEAETSFRVRGY